MYALRLTPRYLLYFRKNVKQKKPNTKDKKQYTPFPPPQQPSKVKSLVSITSRVVVQFTILVSSVHVCYVVSSPVLQLYILMALEAVSIP